MEHNFATQALCALLLSSVVACGAPTKSAGEVAHLFNGSASTLQDKVDGLCHALRLREAAPSTKDWPVAEECPDAGRAALQLQEIKAFQFMGLDGAVPDNKEQLIHKSVRAQVWLNKSLLGLAQALAAKMKANDGVDNKGLLSLPESNKTSGLAKLAQSKITIVEDPKLDHQTLSFSMKINLDLKGVVEANHDIAIDGRLINEAFAVTIQTTADKPFETSILKNFRALLLIVPHASDIYMDLMVDLNAHNVGLETLFKDQLDSFLSTGLKGMIDSVFTL